jgi:hypothetical protein
MRKLVLTTLFLLLVLPSLALAGPAIVFGEQSYDFGAVNGKSYLERTFTFTNAGDQDLIIKKISPP